MECRYCQSANSEDDHRCRRCGRRLRTGPLYTGSSAAAPVLRPRRAVDFELAATPVWRFKITPGLQQEVPEASTFHHTSANRSEPHRSPEPSAPRRPITYQPSLFTSREMPFVVPFETIAPGSAPARKPQPSAPRPRRRKIVPGQQALEFSHAARSSRPADGVIYCDAPVAIAAHRAMAAALDGSVMAIAMAIFGVVFHLAGGAFVLNAHTIPMFAGAVAGIVIFYRLLWCLANSDTAGQSWARLRLVNFDGHIPTPAQRLCRTASGFLSLMAGGIGLLWGLVDEETLTWHDHISKTFPTPIRSVD